MPSLNWLSHDTDFPGQTVSSPSPTGIAHFRQADCHPEPWTFLQARLAAEFPKACKVPHVRLMRGEPYTSLPHSLVIIHCSRQRYEGEKHRAAVWINYAQEQGKKQGQVRTHSVLAQHLSMSPHFLISLSSADPALRKGTLPVISFNNTYARSWSRSS